MSLYYNRNLYEVPMACYMLYNNTCKTLFFNTVVPENSKPKFMHTTTSIIPLLGVTRPLRVQNCSHA